MLQVVIDTTVLFQDPHRSKPAFKMLIKLAKAKKIKVHFPEIVKKEFLGQRWDEYRGVLDSGKSSIDKLSRKKLSQSLKSNLMGKSKSLTRLGPHIKNFIEKDFNDWISDIQGEILTIKPHHGKNVMKGYFSGDPPFSSPRNRPDIPDAFIFESIKDLLKKVSGLTVISKDKNLTGACSNIRAVETYDSLEDFIRADDCHELLKNQYFEDHLEEIEEKLSLKSKELTEKLSFSLSEEQPRPSVRNDYIPSDDNEGIVADFISIDDVEFDFEKLEYLGDGTLFIPFFCKAEGLVEYTIFQNDYYCLPEDRMESISTSTYGNEHYFMAEEYLDLEVHGIFSFTFDLESIEKDEDITENFDILLSEAEFQINVIESVQLQEPSYY